MSSDEKPQLEKPDAPITNEELYLAFVKNEGNRHATTYAICVSVAAATASITGVAPAYFGIALPGAFAAFAVLGALVHNKNSRVAKRLTSLLGKDWTSQADVHERFTSGERARADGGQEVTQNE